MRSYSSEGMCVMADTKSCSPILNDYNPLRAVPQFIISADITLFLLWSGCFGILSVLTLKLIPYAD